MSTEAKTPNGSDKIQVALETLRVFRAITTEAPRTDSTRLATKLTRGVEIKIYLILVIRPINNKLDSNY